MKQEQIPYRFRETAFRRYESTVAQIVQLAPTAATFTPEGSIETFAARLRDAMKSLYTYRWPTELVDMDKFIRLYESRQLPVSKQMNGTVVVGITTTGGMASLPAVFEGQTQVLDNPSLEKLRELAAGLATPGQTPIKIKNLDESLQATIVKEFDVHFEQLNPDIWLMI